MHVGSFPYIRDRQRQPNRREHVLDCYVSAGAKNELAK